MPASAAASFTGENEIAPPRPRGRSGCVTTPSSRKSGSAIRCFNAGTANDGVPQKIIFSGMTRLPGAGFDLLADFALDDVALEHSQMIDEKHAIQMIDFVAKRAREQSLS